jgi:hypothetical protein
MTQARGAKSDYESEDDEEEELKRMEAELKRLESKERDISRSDSVPPHSIH